MELSDYREKIDSIDKELVKLFAERMDTAAEIARYKKEHGMKVLDSARERAKLNDIASMVPEELSEYAISLYSLIFELSRSSQNRIIGASTPLTEEIARAVKDTPPLFPQRAAVACQGVEGAYSQMACDRLFKRANVLYFSTFEAVFSAIEKGLCQYGVIPVENSTAGSVNAVYDLMMKHDFKIVRSVRLKVDHNLLVNHGTKLEDIKEMATRMGARYAQSSIHLNVWFGDYSKSKGLLAFMELCGIDRPTLLDQSIYLGDAPNDDEMFALIPASVGMKSVEERKDEFSHLPAFMTSGYGGTGFAEAIRALKDIS